MDERRSSAKVMGRNPATEKEQKPKPVLENYYRTQAKIDHVQLDRMTGDLSDLEADAKIEKILTATDNYLPF